MKHENDTKADHFFTEDMKEALKSLHVDALIESDTSSFIDEIDGDLRALKRCRQYQEIIEFVDKKFPANEPSHNLKQYDIYLKQYAIYMQEVIMPMLRAVLDDGDDPFDLAPRTENPNDQHQANFTKWLEGRNFNTD